MKLIPFYKYKLKLFKMNDNIILAILVVCFIGFIILEVYLINNVYYRTYNDGKKGTHDTWYIVIAISTFINVLLFAFVNEKLYDKVCVISKQESTEMAPMTM